MSSSKRSSKKAPAKKAAAKATGPKRGRRTVATIERVLRESYGLVSVAATRLEMSRSVLYRRIRKSSRLQEALADAREIVLDTSELKLIQAINRGEAWAISLALKTIGKSRGYVERSEVDNVRDVDLSTVSTEELREWLSRQK